MTLLGITAVSLLTTPFVLQLNTRLMRDQRQLVPLSNGGFLVEHVKTEEESDEESRLGPGYACKTPGALASSNAMCAVGHAGKPPSADGRELESEPKSDSNGSSNGSAFGADSRRRVIKQHDAPTRMSPTRRS